MRMPGTAVHTEASSTRGLPPEESREFWRNLTRTYQCEMSCEFLGDTTFAGALTRIRTPAHQLLTWQSPPIRYRRTARHIRLDQADSYLLVLPAAGTVTIGRGADEVRLDTDSAILMTMTKPFVVTHSADARPLVLTIARQEIDRRLNGRTDTTAPLDLSTGLGNVLGTLLGSALEQREHLSVPQFDAVFDRLHELLCVLMSGTSPAARGQLGEIEAAVRRYVSEHAAATDLNGEAIARALGWSVRQIQLALQQSETTPRDLIREERLTLARTRLTSAAYRHTSIAELAHQSGFGSPGTFSTMFRHRFGITPRELRRTHADPVRPGR